VHGCEPVAGLAALDALVAPRSLRPAESVFNYRFGAGRRSCGADRAGVTVALPANRGGLEATGDHYDAWHGW
jgi:hypothetical protein